MSPHEPPPKPTNSQTDEPHHQPHHHPQGINCTSGNHYNTFWEETLGLDNTDGVARIGFLHYNTMDEVEAVLEHLEHASKTFHK